MPFTMRRSPPDAVVSEANKDMAFSLMALPEYPFTFTVLYAVDIPTLMKV